MKKVWNSFIVNFFNGVVIILPVAVTVVLIRFLVTRVNIAVLEPIMKLVTPLETGAEVVLAKSVIFLGVIFTVALVGWGTRILVIKRTFTFGERFLLKLPVMGRVYYAVKQISSAFLGQGKTIFKQVVLLEYPRKGLYSIGFTTGTTKGEVSSGLKDTAVNVFVPTTPNPTSGVYLVVPRGNIRFLKMSVEEGMKLVISGGSVAPPGSGGAGLPYVRHKQNNNDT